MKPVKCKIAEGIRKFGRCHKLWWLKCHPRLTILYTYGIFFTPTSVSWASYGKLWKGYGQSMLWTNLQVGPNVSLCGMIL